MNDFLGPDDEGDCPGIASLEYLLSVNYWKIMQPRRRFLDPIVDHRVEVPSLTSFCSFRSRRIDLMLFANIKSTEGIVKWPISANGLLKSCGFRSMMLSFLFDCVLELLQIRKVFAPVLLEHSSVTSCKADLR